MRRIFTEGEYLNMRKVGTDETGVAVVQYVSRNKRTIRVAHVEEKGALWQCELRYYKAHRTYRASEGHLNGKRLGSWEFIGVAS